MKRFHKLLSFLLTIALIASSFVYPYSESEAAKKKPTVSKVAYANVGKTLIMKKGKSFTLKTSVTVKPNSKANRKVTFKSNKPKVVSVSPKGVLKAKASKGSAKITATSTKNKKRKATVTVRIGKPVTSVSVSQKTLELEVNGKDYILQAAVKPSNATIQKVTWSSSNSKVAKVSKDGTVIPLSEGKANITVTATDGSSKKSICKVTVVDQDKIAYPWRTATTLKDLYKNNFLVGVGIGGSELLNGQPASLIRHHFNSVTMGNEMKPENLLDWQKSNIQAESGGSQISPVIKFDNLDTYLSYAQKNNLKVRFHTLLWHNQTPEWFFCKDFDHNNEYVDKDTMYARMNSFITQIIDYTESKYPGVIYAWDVVNEGLEQTASDYESVEGIQYRTKSSYTQSGVNAWYKILGHGYIKQAFKFTKEALKKNGSNAKLFYNDYNTYMKTTTIINLFKHINQEEKLCDGVGMQAHVSTTFPSMSDFEGTIKRFVDAGMEIQITELDIGLYRHTNYELEKQATMYRSYFEMFQKYPEVTSVTIWGLGDDLGNWRVNEKPLLFNSDYTPKAAFWAVLKQN